MNTAPATFCSVKPEKEHRIVFSFSPQLASTATTPSGYDTTIFALPKKRTKRNHKSLSVVLFLPIAFNFVLALLRGAFGYAAHMNACLDREHVLRCSVSLITQSRIRLSLYTYTQLLFTAKNTPRVRSSAGFQCPC